MRLGGTGCYADGDRRCLCDPPIPSATVPFSSRCSPTRCNRQRLLERLARTKKQPHYEGEREHAASVSLTTS